MSPKRLLALVGAACVLANLSVDAIHGWHWSAERTLPIYRAEATLRSPGANEGNGFGNAVAVDDETAVVGAPSFGSDAGRAYVFSETRRGWSQTGELKGADTKPGDYFGSSVAISGNNVVVGAWRASRSGRAYVFTHTAKGWLESAELKDAGTAPGDAFYQVAIWGNTIVVGAPGHSANAGRAYVFQKTGPRWEQVAQLSGNDTEPGDQFGSSVAVYDSTILVGAAYHDLRSGRAYVFVRKSSSWNEEEDLKGTDSVADDYFGSSVSIAGSLAVVTALGHGLSLPKLYIFKQWGVHWLQLAEVNASNTPVDENLGYLAAVSGSTVVMCSTSDKTLASVFRATSSGLIETAQLDVPILAPSYTAFAVALTANTVVIGADNQHGTTGLAYVFRL